MNPKIIGQLWSRFKCQRRSFSVWVFFFNNTFIRIKSWSQAIFKRTKCWQTFVWLSGFMKHTDHHIRITRTIALLMQYPTISIETFLNRPKNPRYFYLTLHILYYEGGNHKRSILRRKSRRNESVSLSFLPTQHLNQELPL